MGNAVQKNDRNSPKTLVVGCGGTGQRVLKMLSRKLLEEEVPGRSAIELLAIDTLSSQEMWGDVQLPMEDYLPIKPVQLDKFIHAHYEKDDNVKRWFRKEQSAGLMSTGAMQIRSFGRLALFLDVVNVESKLREKINLLAGVSHIFPEETESSVIRTKSDDAIQVHIVTSIAGGTGAGITLDLAYLLRSVSVFPLTISAHLVMPEVITDVQVQDSIYANAYAFLKELESFNHNPDLYASYSPITDYLKSLKDSSVSDKSAGLSSEDGKLRQRPFDYTFLLSPNTLKSTFLPKEMLFEIISEKIILSTFNEVGNREQERVVNIQTNVLNNLYKDNIDLKSGRLCSYSSYGVSTLKVKKDIIKKKITESIYKKIVSMFEKAKSSNSVVKLNECQLQSGFERIIDEIVEFEKLDWSSCEAASPDELKNNHANLYDEQAKIIKDKIDQGEIDAKLKELVFEHTIFNDALFLTRISNDPFYSVADIEIGADANELRLCDASKLFMPPLFGNLPAHMNKALKIYCLCSLVARYEKLRNKAQQLIKFLESSLETVHRMKFNDSKGFDDILFYNFPIEKITDYISSNSSSKDLADLTSAENRLAMFEAYRSELNMKQDRFNDLIQTYTETIWSSFSQVYKDNNQAEEDSRQLTVENFFSNMFDVGGTGSQIDTILNVFHTFAAPCWRYHNHFVPYVTTIPLIGCKDDNLIYKRVKGLSFSGAELESSGHEENPYEIPLVVSQHGLPLIGYELLSDYRKSYEVMRKAFGERENNNNLALLFYRQFHLDKRWEDPALDPLVDPFRDLSGSDKLHVDNQYFALAMGLGIISRIETHTFKFKVEDSDNVILSNKGLVKAVEMFIASLDKYVSSANVEKKLRKWVDDKIKELKNKEDPEVSLSQKMKDCLSRELLTLFDEIKERSENDKEKCRELCLYLYDYIEEGLNPIKEKSESMFAFKRNFKSRVNKIIEKISEDPARKVSK